MIRIKNLHKRFDELEVLKGIDLDVEKGRVVVVIGPSGSGKTTLLRCLNVLEPPTLGIISIEDQSLDFSQSIPKRKIPSFRSLTGMVFQSYNLFPHMTASRKCDGRPSYSKKRVKRDRQKEGRRASVEGRA